MQRQSPPAKGFANSAQRPPSRYRPVTTILPQGQIFCMIAQILPTSVKCPLCSPRTLVPFPSLLQKSQSLMPFMVETKTLIWLLFELILQNRLSPMKCDCPILCVCSGKWHLSWISGILCYSIIRSYCECLFLALSQKTSCGKTVHLIWMLLGYKPGDYSLHKWSQPLTPWYIKHYCATHSFKSSDCI